MQERIQCRICPRSCMLAPGEHGICRVRVNRQGRIVATTYARPCAIHVDPIEKKPLLHFLPGAAILSLGFVGCNLRCRHCQNADISQGDPETIPSIELLPAAAIAQAQRQGIQLLAYTYNEPLVNFEYVLECAQLARRAGLRNVLVTAGYIQPEPLAQLLPLLDGVNLDIKALDDAFYRTVCQGNLAPVLAAARQIHAAGVHLEITNLVIPTLNDSAAQLTALSHWVVQNLGTETPLHFSRFFPCYQLTGLPPTPVDTLRRAHQLARDQGARHVYLGNAALEDGSDTFCAACGTRLIRRQNYMVRSNRVNADGTCSACGARLAGVWQQEH